MQPVESFQGENSEDGALCREQFDGALRYVASFDWCGGINEIYVGHCIGGIISLLLVRIAPARANVDEWIWVVYGDLPPAYIAPADARPSEALAAYLHQMRRWVDAAQAGEPVDGLIPVNVPPTREWAEQLGRRLGFLETEVLPEVV